jgi:hypothetical protein
MPDINRRGFLRFLAVSPAVIPAAVEILADPDIPSRDENSDPVPALLDRLRAAEADHERTLTALRIVEERFITTYGLPAVATLAWRLEWCRACWPEAKAEDVADAAVGQIRADILNTKATTPAGVAVKLDLAVQALDRKDPGEVRDLLQSAMDDLQSLEASA